MKPLNNLKECEFQKLFGSWKVSDLVEFDPVHVCCSRPQRLKAVWIGRVFYLASSCSHRILAFLDFLNTFCCPSFSELLCPMQDQPRCVCCACAVRVLCVCCVCAVRVLSRTSSLPHLRLFFNDHGPVPFCLIWKWYFEYFLYVLLVFYS